MNMGEFQEIADRLTSAKDDRLEFPEAWHVDAKAGLIKIMSGDTVVARMQRQHRLCPHRDAVIIAAATTMKAMLHKFLETGLDADKLTALAQAVDNFLNDLEARS